MTDQTQQGYTIWDLAAVASTLVGLASIVAAVFLPGRDIGIAVALAVAALVLAVASGARAHKSGTRASWFSRLGSLAAVAGIVVIVAGEFMRNA